MRHRAATPYFLLPDPHSSLFTVEFRVLPQCLFEPVALDTHDDKPRILVHQLEDFWIFADPLFDQRVSRARGRLALVRNYQSYPAFP